MSFRSNLSYPRLKGKLPETQTRFLRPSSPPRRAAIMISALTVSATRFPVKKTSFCSCSRAVKKSCNAFADPDPSRFRSFPVSGASSSRGSRPSYPFKAASRSVASLVKSWRMCNSLPNTYSAIRSCGFTCFRNVITWLVVNGWSWSGVFNASSKTTVMLVGTPARWSARFA